MFHRVYLIHNTYIVPFQTSPKIHLAKEAEDYICQMKISTPDGKESIAHTGCSVNSLLQTTSELIKYGEYSHNGLVLTETSINKMAQKGDQRRLNYNCVITRKSTQLL